jgi:hypothetical protein
MDGAAIAGGGGEERWRGEGEEKFSSFCEVGWVLGETTERRERRRRFMRVWIRGKNGAASRKFGVAVSKQGKELVTW